jgi:hypothetical protein
MSKYTNSYSQKVYEVLLPLLGDLMAQSVLKIHTIKVGTTIENLNANQMPALAQSIRSGLIIFLGSDAAQTICAKIMSIH